MTDWRETETEEVIPGTMAKVCTLTIELEDGTRVRASKCATIEPAVELDDGDGPVTRTEDETGVLIRALERAKAWLREER